MAEPRRHFQKKPEFAKTASKEPAIVEKALQEIADEAEIEEADEEYLPGSQSVSCFVVLYVLLLGI